MNNERQDSDKRQELDIILQMIKEYSTMLQKSCERYEILRNRRAIMISSFFVIVSAVAVFVVIFLMKDFFNGRFTEGLLNPVLAFVVGFGMMMSSSLVSPLFLRSRVLSAQRRGIEMLSRQTSSLVARARAYEDKEKSLRQKLELDFCLIEVEVALNYSASFSRTAAREKEVRDLKRRS